MGADLTGTGLQVVGIRDGPVADGLPYDGQVILPGPHEPGFWSAFQTSPEATGDTPDPLDRWSRRIIDSLAAACGGTAVHPFGGPPFPTFATRSGATWPSPIGLLIHANVGLWVSFRGAILIRTPARHAVSTHKRPCDTCPARCTTACPIDAFSNGNDIAACKTRINGPARADCITRGCPARRICPVGADLRLPAQAAFHMEAFR